MACGTHLGNVRTEVRHIRFFNSLHDDINAQEGADLVRRVCLQDIDRLTRGTK